MKMKPRRFTSKVLALSILLYTLFTIVLVSLTHCLGNGWKPYIGLGAVGCLVGNVILWLGLRTMTGSFGKAWQDMEKLNNMRQRKAYEDRHKIELLESFAPAEFEALLLRECGVALEIGGQQEAAGTLGFVTFISNAKRQEVHIDHNYVRTVNELLRQLQETAIYLPDSSNLQAMTLIYKDSVQKAVDCTVKALAVFYEGTSEKASEAHTINPVMVMHHTFFAGGLAGTAQQAFPFIEAPEMRQLTAYTELFRDCHVRMIMTGDILAHLTAPPKVRYVGKIPMAADEKVYERKITLYEVLVVYAYQEQNVKQSTEGVFQKALEFYHTKDYYLARNTFTEVLKKNPADGVAKWYLFACEKNLTI